MPIRLLGFTPLFTVLVLTPAFASDQLPAVSAPNLKADLAAGSSDGDLAGISSLSATVPIGDASGFQLDSAFGKVGDQNLGGAGAHLFWRDPNSMLLGVTGMVSRVEGASDNLARAGLESEFYQGNFTISASAGGQWDFRGTTAYSSVGTSYYVTPNFILSSRVSGFSNVRTIQIGSEYRPKSHSRTTFYADIGTDNDHNEFALAGIRFSFGGTGKTIKDRDRQDDPINIVSSLMSSSAQAVKERTGAVKEPTVAVPKTTVVNGGGGGGSVNC
jgi:hypothetical protein